MPSSVQVMDYIGITSVPEKHILKRWTQHARDVLPTHLRHYRRDKVAGNGMTYRHSTLYMIAIEAVRLGDSCAATYDAAYDAFKDMLVKLAPFEHTLDGLALEDRVGTTTRKRKGNADVENVDTGDMVSAVADGLAGLTAPAKKLKPGRHSTSRDRAPYEALTKRTRFCTICRNPGHKRTTCPHRGDEPKIPRKPGKCILCGVTGHRKDTCGKKIAMRCNLLSIC